MIAIPKFLKFNLGSDAGRTKALIFSNGSTTVTTAVGSLVTAMSAIDNTVNQSETLKYNVEIQHWNGLDTPR